MTSQPRTTTGIWSLVGSAGVGPCAVGIGLVAHLAAGGTSPSIGVLVSASLVGAAPAVLLRHRRWVLRDLLVVLAVVQAAFHVILSEYGAGHPPTPGRQVLGPHQHSHVESVGPAGLDMTVAHFTAALLLALLLRYSATLLERLANLLGRRAVRAALVSAPVTLPRSRIPVIATAARLITQHLGTTTRTRGPPAAGEDLSIRADLVGTVHLPAERCSHAHVRSTRHIRHRRGAHGPCHACSDRRYGRGTRRA